MKKVFELGDANARVLRRFYLYRLGSLGSCHSMNVVALEKS